MLLLGGILWFIFRPADAGEQSMVRITVNGQVYGEYPLDEDLEIPIHDTNICVIENGTVYMKSAYCPDQICVKTKPIHNRAASIICLPNKVSVEIVGGSADTEEPDAIVR